MLEFHDVSVKYGKKQVLSDVTFSLRPHRLTVLLGRNGTGKSTLMACVNQELPYTGSIRDGEKDLALLPPRERAKAIALLPQNIPAPHILTEELVAFGRNPYLDLTGRLSHRDREMIDRAITDADADSLRGRYVDTLSGGERQRVNLAMILAQNTPIVLMDEPTAHMDLSHEAAFLRRIAELNRKRKKTFLLILHDLTLAAEFADDMVILSEGSVAFSGTREQALEQEILEKAFHVRRFTATEAGAEKLFFSAL